MSRLFCCASLYIMVFLLAGTAGAGEPFTINPGGGRTDMHKRTDFIMGSLMDISIAAASGIEADRITEMAFDEVRRLDKLMSNYRDDSELARINRDAAIAPVRCESELLYIIELAMYYSRITGGAFDITVYPLVKMWGFFGNSDGGIDGRIPDDKEIKQIMPAVSYKNIVIARSANGDAAGATGTISFENRDTQIDLGAIGKGYAVDRAAAILKDAGIESALINFAGNIYAYGSPRGREMWTIGVKDPVRPDSIMGKFKIAEGAIATSGNYEKFFLVDGRRYTHILDPRTGMPVSGVLGVTICADNAAMADALSTAVFVLGPADGLDLLEGLDGAEGIIVYEDAVSSRVATRATTTLGEMLEIDGRRPSGDGRSEQ